MPTFPLLSCYSWLKVENLFFVFDYSYTQSLGFGEFPDDAAVAFWTGILGKHCTLRDSASNY